MTDLKAVLRAAGLPDTEATVYLALLRLGGVPVSTIARRTKLPRSTVQFTCLRLLQRGVAHVTVEHRTHYYAPEPPEKLLSLLVEQQQRLAARGRALRQALGDLHALMGPHVRLPKVEYYEGERGLTALYDKILDLRQPIDSIEDKGEMVRIIPEYVRSFVRRRVARGIPKRVICPEGNPVNLPRPEELREVRLLPTDAFPFTGDIKICGDLVSLFSFERHSPVGIAIRHQNFADNFRLLHATLWEQLSDEGEFRRGR
jgi:sugar-specific transcriptional regulator TrmB